MKSIVCNTLIIISPILSDFFHGFVSMYFLLHILLPIFFPLAEDHHQFVLHVYSCPTGAKYYSYRLLFLSHVL